MINEVHVSKKIRKKMEEAGVDAGLTLDILNNYNRGRYDHVRPLKADSLPEPDGKRIVDVRSEVSWKLDKETARMRCAKIDPNIDPEEYGKADEDGRSVVFDREALQRLGRRLLLYVSYGILNGGSATSYFDRRKNSSFHSGLFDQTMELFGPFAEKYAGKSKGVTPGFVNPDGTGGLSFIELTMRSLLVAALRYRREFGRTSADDARRQGTAAPADSVLEPLFPMFQMTSVRNNTEILKAYEQFRRSPCLEPLIEETGLNITEVLTGVQPLIAAYTHSEEGTPKFLFTRAYGKKDEILPLPGGHGQNFFVLKEVYTKLYEMGKRFVYLTNVDNLGSTVDPVSIALMALSGKQAGFDFSYRTPVDVKGGILVEDRHYGLTCADIGPAISKDEVFSYEASGTPVLFNCATGLFSLEYLVPRLDEIAERLPVRFSDQNKDAGKYSQAEQVTWEVLSLLDDFLVFAVDKYERFLAAKLFLENLLTSGIGLDVLGDEKFHDVAEKLHHGLVRKLETDYGMKQVGGVWMPMTPEELAG